MAPSLSFSEPCCNKNSEGYVNTARLAQYIEHTTALNSQISFIGIDTFSGSSADCKVYIHVLFLIHFHCVLLSNMRNGDEMTVYCCYCVKW